MFAGPPVEVGVTMYVLSISSVSEVLMVLISDMTFLLCVVLACRTKAAGPPGALPLVRARLGAAPGAPAANPNRCSTCQRVPCSAHAPEISDLCASHLSVTQAPLAYRCDWGRRDFR